MTTEHQALKEGVANFRTFQARGNTFFDKADAIWRSDDMRRRRNLVIVGIFAAFLTPGIYAGVHWVTTTIDTILQIEMQWKEAHPSEFVRPATGDAQNARNIIEEKRW